MSSPESRISILFVIHGHCYPIQIKFANMKVYRFIKEGRDWYIDLPEYLAQGGSRGDLQMVEGADHMLDVIAEKNIEVSLFLQREYFEGADRLVLIERCDPYVGGGYYLLESLEGKEYNKKMWLCGVTEFVFGELPIEIFLKVSHSFHQP